MSEMMETGSGNDLKKLRESRGLTIEAIFKATRVRPIFLEAIENGNFQVLPERIYSEAFIKTYAAHIGASPEDILARYRNFLKIPEPGKAADKKPEKKADKKPEKRKDEGKTPEPSKSPEAPLVKSPLNVPKRRFSRVAISLLLTVLVICGGFLYFLLSDDASSPDVLLKAEKSAAPAQPVNPVPPAPPATVKPGENPQQPSAEQSGTTPSAPAGQGAPAPEAKPAAAASNKLIVHANQLTWISVTEDGSQPYQIMLRPGDNLERVAGKFTLDIGNAGGIVVNFNGADLGVPGRSGQVVHLILPQEAPKEAPKE